MIITISREFRRRSLKFVRPHLTKDVVRRIISCGLPNFLNNVAGRLASIVMNTMLVNDLQDKPEGLDVSVLPIGSVSGLPVAPHPYG